jgi:hypothetical protein
VAQAGHNRQGAQIAIILGLICCGSWR